MVEVFKTDVREMKLAQQIIRKLAAYLPGCKINFDLHDCDNILTVEGNEIQADRIMRLMQKYGCYCHVLS